MLRGIILLLRPLSQRDERAVRSCIALCWYACGSPAEFYLLTKFLSMHAGMLTARHCQRKVEGFSAFPRAGQSRTHRTKTWCHDHRWIDRDQPAKFLSPYMGTSNFIHDEA